MDFFSPLFEILKSIASMGAHVATAVIALLLSIILIQNRRMIRNMYSRNNMFFLSEKPPSLDCRINRHLDDLVSYLQAGSISIVQWHNGHHNLTGIPFYFASLTHIRPIEKSHLLRDPAHRSVQSSVIATTHDMLKSKFLLEYPDIEEMRQHDMGLYYILKERSCTSAYIAGVYNIDGTPIAYIGIHFYKHRVINDDERRHINRLAKILSGALCIHEYDRRQ